MAVGTYARMTWATRCTTVQVADTAGVGVGCWMLESMGSMGGATWEVLCVFIGAYGAMG